MFVHNDFLKYPQKLCLLIFKEYWKKAPCIVFKLVPIRLFFAKTFQKFNLFSVFLNTVKLIPFDIFKNWVL